VLIDRFFSEDSYLGDKHFLISIFTEAAQELSDNPKKYLSDVFNEFEPKDDGVFYFKKIATSYCIIFDCISKLIIIIILHKCRSSLDF